MTVSYRFSAPAWCRHKDQFVTYGVDGNYNVTATCSNCTAVGVGSSRGAARDALMKIEKVGAVSEVRAP